MSTIGASRVRSERRTRATGEGARHSGAFQRMWRYALVRPAGSKVRRTGIVLGLLVGASLLAASGAIHLQLWSTGYRSIPTIGPLFLVQGASGLLLAALLLLTRRLLVVVMAAGFMIATIGGLLLSVYVGLFGFMETLAAPYAGLSLGVESAGAVVLAIVGIVLVHGLRDAAQLRPPDDTTHGWSGISNRTLREL
jgi:hypothetical protein